MNTKLLILTAFILSGLNSCKKASNTVTEASPLKSMQNALARESGSTDYNLFINLDRSQGVPGSSSNSYGFWANFDGSNIGTIKVNNVSLIFNASTNSYSLDNSSNPALLGNNESQYFGIENSINVHGKIIKFYAPKIISPTFLNLTSAGDFSKTNGIKLSWNTDANNPNGKVGIAIEYSPITWRNSSLFPAQQLMGKFYTVNGSPATFTIPAADLTAFPTGCMPIIHIGRLNEQINADQTSYLALTTTHCFGTLLK